MSLSEEITKAMWSKVEADQVVTEAVHWAREALSPSLDYKMENDGRILLGDDVIFWMERLREFCQWVKPLFQDEGWWRE